MKHLKPLEECAVTPGKLLSAFPGFVDMWNWLMQTIFNFTFGPGLALHEDELGHKSAYLNIEWGDGFEVETDEESGRVFVKGGGGGKVQGNDGGEPVSGSPIVFQAADDSNVKISATKGANGEVIVKIGVYYK